MAWRQSPGGGGAEGHASPSSEGVTPAALWWVEGVLGRAYAGEHEPRLLVGVGVCLPACLPGTP